MFRLLLFCSAEVLQPLTDSSVLCKLAVSAQLTGGAGSQLKSLGTYLSRLSFLEITLEEGLPRFSQW